MSVINTNQLKSALERLCLVVPKRGTLPVLENLRWRAANGHLGLTATDLDNHLHISIPVVGEAIDSDVDALVQDRKSTRLNSSHGYISYAVFCLKKKTHNIKNRRPTSSCK